MTDNNDKKPGGRRPLTLGGGARTPTRRSGQTSAVVVEKKKKVIMRPGTKAPGAPKTLRRSLRPKRHLPQRLHLSPRRLRSQKRR